VIYYTLNGSLPTQGSTLYTGAVALASASVLRAPRSRMAGRRVSRRRVLRAAGLPVNAQVTRSVSGNGTAAPVVTFNVTPGTNANWHRHHRNSCPRHWRNQHLVWRQLRRQQNSCCGGRSLERVGFSLSYQPWGCGRLSCKVSWSVDGVSGSETTGPISLSPATELNGTIPTQPRKCRRRSSFHPALGGSVDVLIGLPAGTLLCWMTPGPAGTRSLQNCPRNRPGSCRVPATNLTAGVNALNFWNGTNAVAGITYSHRNATTPVSLGIGDTLKATLKLVLTKVARPTRRKALRIGLFDFVDSSLSPPRASSDGFAARAKVPACRDTACFKTWGQISWARAPVDVRVRTNILSGSLLAYQHGFRSLTARWSAINFPGFTAGRQYVLTLTSTALLLVSLAFSASWLDTTTGGTFSKAPPMPLRPVSGLTAGALGQPPRHANKDKLLMRFKMDYIRSHETAPPRQPARRSITRWTARGRRRVRRFTPGRCNWHPPEESSGRGFSQRVGANVPSVVFTGRWRRSNVQVTRSVSGNGSAAPVGGRSTDRAPMPTASPSTETLPLALAATSISSAAITSPPTTSCGGGPFFETSGFSLSIRPWGSGRVPAKGIVELAA